MPSPRYDVVVIGAGPGGYVCAIRCSQLGKKVALVDRGNLGGTCLHWGCIPSKALIQAANFYERIGTAAEMGIQVGAARMDLNGLQTWKQSIIKRLSMGIDGLLKANKVDLILGEARFLSAKTLEVKGTAGTQTVEAGAFVIATGARPVQLPGMPFDGKTVISSKEALELTTLPKKMLLVGGGVIGLEIGLVYAKLGTEVTIVELLPQLLSGTDPDLVKVVDRSLRKRKVKVYLKTKVSGATKTPQGMKVTMEGEKGAETWEGDVVLVAVGVKPASDLLNLEVTGVKRDPRGFIPVNEKLQSSVPTIYAIGDINGPPLLAHKASREGIVAAEVIAGKSTVMDIQAMPAAIFTDPEIATVGLSEEQARAKGYDLRIGTFAFTGNGRALTTGHSDGLVKIIGDKKTDRVLGVHIVGPEASDLISEAALAIEMGATIEDIALTVHPHPTLPEAMLEAAEAALGHAIHAVNR